MNIWRLVKIRKHEDGPKGLVINYGEGGLQNGKIAGPKLVPPPSRQGKTFCAPPFKEWKLFPPPLQYGLNL